MKTQKTLSQTFRKVAFFPMGILLVHILMMLSGKVFTDEGGWMVLYTLLLICVPLIVLLFAISWVLAKRERIADEDGASLS